MAINRCSNTTRISKATVKAMMQTASVVGIKPGDTVRYTENGRVYSYPVIKVNADTVELDQNGETLVVSKSAVQGKPPTFLDKLSDDEWSITSFDPPTRTVCIRVSNGRVENYVSLVLPVLTAG